MGFIRSGVVVRSLSVAVAVALGAVGCGTALDSSGLGGPGNPFPDAGSDFGSADVGMPDAPLDIAPDGLGDHLPDFGVDAGADVAPSETVDPSDAPDAVAIDVHPIDSGADVPVVDSPPSDGGVALCMGAPPTGPSSAACAACEATACAAQYATFQSACVPTIACYGGCNCSDTTCVNACTSAIVGTCNVAGGKLVACSDDACSSVCAPSAPADAGAESVPDGSLVELGNVCAPADVCAEGTCMFGYCANKCDFTSDPVCPTGFTCTGTVPDGYWCIR